MYTIENKLGVFLGQSIMIIIPVKCPLFDSISLQITKSFLCSSNRHLGLRLGLERQRFQEREKKKKGKTFWGTEN